MTKMTELFARQGIQTKTKDDWLQYEEAKRQRRNKNIAAAREVLARNHIKYHEFDTFFVIPVDQSTTIHYYPPTGEWIETNTGHKGFGIRNLVRHIKGEVL